MVKIANKNGRGYVKGCWAFQGSNVFGRWESRACYVVYSYGEHFPMYAKIRGAWYANKDKYSVSTSRHQSQYRPDEIIVDALSTECLKARIAEQVDGDLKEKAALGI